MPILSCRRPRAFSWERRDGRDGGIMPARKRRMFGTITTAVLAMLPCAQGQTLIADGRAWGPDAGELVQVPAAPKKSEIAAAGGFLVPGVQVRQMHLGNTVYYTLLAPLVGLPRGVVVPAF